MENQQTPSLLEDETLAALDVPPWRSSVMKKEAHGGVKEEEAHGDVKEELHGAGTQRQQTPSTFNVAPDVGARDRSWHADRPIYGETLELMTGVCQRESMVFAHLPHMNTDSPIELSSPRKFARLVPPPTSPIDFTRPPFCRSCSASLVVDLAEGPTLNKKCRVCSTWH